MKRQDRLSDQASLEFDLPLRPVDTKAEAGSELPRAATEDLHPAASIPLRSPPLRSPPRSKAGPENRQTASLPATSRDRKPVTEPVANEGRGHGPESSLHEAEPPTVERRARSSKGAEEDDHTERTGTVGAWSRATAGARLVAGLADLVILGAIAASMSWSLLQAGIPTSPAQLGPLALFHVTFSFLYTVISLAFWGHTPGMSAMGISARTPAGETLTFPQAALRWLGAALTLVLLGTPLLLALFGRSLSDRISGSVTLQRRR